MLWIELSMGTEVLTEKYEYTLYRNLYQSQGQGSIQGDLVFPFNKTETTVTFLFK
jgi:hypothetical protein